MKRRRERKTKGKRTVYNATITQIRISICLFVQTQMRCSRLAFPSACLVDTPSHLYPPFVSFSRLRQVERMECGCVYDILSGSGTRSKTFRSCKIHRIYKLCRTARTEAADSRRSRDATTHGRERKNVYRNCSTCDPRVHSTKF